MKKYFAVFVICAVLLLAGCGLASPSVSSTVFKGPWSGEPDTQISDSADVSDSTDSSGGSDFTSSNPEVSKTELENAAKNVWLFGKKITLPCRFEEFGEDFSLGDQNFYQLDNNDLIAFLNYKGKVIGEVILENCSEEDPNKSAKKVIQLALGDAKNNPVNIDGWHSGEIYFDVLGITMKSTSGEVEELLGKPTKKRQLSGKRSLVTYKISDEKYIEITFKDDKIVEFVIESK